MSEVEKCNKCGTVHSDNIDCQAELVELPFRCFETLDLNLDGINKEALDHVDLGVINSLE